MATQTRSLKRFIANEQAAVLFLLVATAVALLWANTPWGASYERFWESWVGLAQGDLRLGLSLRHVVNDGLMALFFLNVGCELKREGLVGELSSGPQVRLPLLAALGGMIVPALFYIGVNLVMAPSFEAARPLLRGWATPTATDIAFALGVFGFLGSRVPTSLRTFLLALAVLDDLGSVVLIGLFYSAGLNWIALGAAALLMAALWGLNKKGVTAFTPYALLGVALWGVVQASGIHATLAGLFLASALPLRMPTPAPETPRLVPLLSRVETSLHPWVAYIVLPLFALANAGVSVQGVSAETLASPVLWGIVVGLLGGKTVGVFSATWLAVKLGLSPKPRGARWRQIFGLSILCGIGFTMSLFISLLAFTDPGTIAASRMGILAGSTVSAFVGYLVLRGVSQKAEA